MNLEEQILCGLCYELKNHYGDHAFSVRHFPNVEAIYSIVHDLWIFVDGANIQVVVSENTEGVQGKIKRVQFSKTKPVFVIFTLDMTKPDTEIQPLIDFLDSLGNTDEP